MTAQPMFVDFDNGGQQVGGPDDAFAGLPVPPELEVDPHVDEHGVQHDPDVMNAAAATALSSDEPAEDISITGPPDGTVRLLAGYVDEDGRRHTTAQVRELRGRDEESIAKALATGDAVRFLAAIIKAGLVEVGDVEAAAVPAKEFDRIMDSLLVGDRDLIALQVRRLAYGDTIRLNVTCPHCEDQYQVDYSFSEDVPLKAFPLDPTQRTFDLDLPSGSTARCRLVDGLAQRTVFSVDPKDVRTDEEFNTALLVEVLESVDGRPVHGPSPVLDMVSKDRRFLLRWLAENQPGPQYDDVEHECDKCLRSFPLRMTLMSMFRSD